MSSDSSYRFSRGSSVGKLFFCCSRKGCLFLLWLLLLAAISTTTTTLAETIKAIPFPVVDGRRTVSRKRTLLSSSKNVHRASRYSYQSASSRATKADFPPFKQQQQQQQQRSAPILAIPFSKSWWWYHVRVGLSGGLAGAVGTTLLYPIDAAKTLRQANPEQFKSVLAALLSSPSNRYRGVVPAALGAIPASALYFGAYESMKSLLLQLQVNRNQQDNKTATTCSRLVLHACAAASGKILSSAVFVPKEFIKQQLQYGASTSVRHCIAQHGLRGLYRSYQATLLRNIPSAALRFVLYEELKYAFYTSKEEGSVGSWRLFAAGAVAGGLTSGLLTPLDVLKSRISVGQCPVDLPGCIHHVLDTSGWTAFYAGAGSRMLFSGLFSATGFGTFETVKRWLNVSSRTVQEDGRLRNRLEKNRIRER